MAAFMKMDKFLGRCASPAAQVNLPAPGFGVFTFLIPSFGCFPT